MILGPYTIAPQGLAYRVEITLRYGEPGPAFVPNPAPERAAGRGRTWYRGDLHLHTVHSDGQRTPAEVAAGARAAGLVTTPQVSGYVRAEVRRPDPAFGPLGAMVAMTNPVFLGRVRR